MLESSTSEFFHGKNARVTYIKDKMQCNSIEQADPNNRLYLGSFLYEHFHGINTIPTNFPSFKLHYVIHDQLKVDCPLIGDDGIVSFPHIKRHRTVLHVIFYSTNFRDILLKYMRDDLQKTNELTYEIVLYFANANAAKVYLNWKEARTQSEWDLVDPPHLYREF